MKVGQNVINCCLVFNIFWNSVSVQDGSENGAECVAGFLSVYPLI